MAIKPWQTIKKKNSRVEVTQNAIPVSKSTYENRV